ncbi:MAG TPA: electron transport complex subunit RsxG [Gammaproteobacteria bacterium]|nr:electron transport complex subunit RsxG [Gammaproteobacteria bacterium]
MQNASRRVANALKTLALVGIVAVAAALLVTGSHELARGRIGANDRARTLASLESVLPAALRRRGLVPTQITAVDKELLGSAAPIDVFVFMSAGQPAAVIFTSIAPEAYNGPIKLLVGLTPRGTVTGVRVLSERETPGLGDRIEIGKSDWIRQFDGKGLGKPPLEQWAVRKDGGRFDALTGATITPRAVVKAVKNTLLYFRGHRDQLFTKAARAAAANGAARNRAR